MSLNTDCIFILYMYTVCAKSFDNSFKFSVKTIW